MNVLIIEVVLTLGGEDRVLFESEVGRWEKDLIFVCHILLSDYVITSKSKLVIYEVSKLIKITRSNNIRNVPTPLIRSFCKEPF